MRSSEAATWRRDKHISEMIEVPGSSIKAEVRNQQSSTMLGGSLPNAYTSGNRMWRKGEMLKNLLPLGELSAPYHFKVNSFTTWETLVLPGLP